MEQKPKTRPGSPDFWDNRYSSHVSVYGDEPNAFFKENLQNIPAGKLLLPAEGEGRNAVYAAKRGWQVDAIDYSPAARSKALARAEEAGVSISYTVADLNDVTLPSQGYDAIALIYLHLEPGQRRSFHRQMVNALKSGGQLIFEAFSKEQIRNSSGGPGNENLLYSMSDLEDDFSGLDFSVSSQEEIRLNEGPFHQGKAHVIRILATKL